MPRSQIKVKTYHPLLFLNNWHDRLRRRASCDQEALRR